MYSVIRPLLFCMDPEAAHTVALNALRIYPDFMKPALPQIPLEVMGLKFPNPVGTAAGLDKNGDYINAWSSVGFGFLEVGTVTPDAQAGNPKPRLFRLPAAHAIINRMGFCNKGSRYLVERIEHARRCGYQGIIGVNIGKNHATPLASAHEDYLCCFRCVRSVASYVAVNVSSPNTPLLRDLQSGLHLRAILERLVSCREQSGGSESTPPILVKVSPDLDDDAIQSIADIVRSTGIEGVIAANTTVQKTAVASLPNSDEEGGLSGRPLRRRTEAIIRRWRDLLQPPYAIIGVGGIDDPDDARRFLEAGADLIQIYTGLIYTGPGLVRRILNSLDQRLPNSVNQARTA